MGFKDQQLQSSETLIIEAHPHFITVLWPLVLFILSLILGFGLAQWQQTPWFLLLVVPFALWFFWKWIVRMTSEYIVTDCRVVKQQGVFTRTSIDAPLDKINNIFHEQNLIQRALGYGKVGLETASELGMVDFPDVPRPLTFKNTIVSQRENYKGKFSRQ